MADSTNPGLVEVENQGFALAAAPPPVVTTPAASSAPRVNADRFNPTSPNVINTTANTVIGQPSSVPQFRSTINVNV